MNKISHYSETKPGIVTAANNFFIVTEEIERLYNLTDFLHPIIQKGMFINGSVVFDENDFTTLVANGKPTKILVFNDEDADSIPLHIQEYLNIGILWKLPLRYKCTKRKNWFVIPNISTIPQGFFFKRSHLYPKILKNSAGVLVTDSAYKIQMRPGFEINDFIYSFYNSLTLVFSEMDGRYYGGGVLELTPVEFKNLPIPLTHITAAEFEVFRKNFEEKSNINEILNANDTLILSQSLDLNSETVERVHNIYNAFVKKRLRK